MNKFSNKTDPTKDTGWGLIFRLNDLWNDVERLSTSGKYDDWNFKLDRIHSNLLYRNKFDIEEENGEIISLKLCEDDCKIKNYLDKQIKKAKKEIRISQKSGEISDKKLYLQGKNDLYQSLMLKEIWLRKFMNELNLYIKEVKHNPAGAMWGK